MQPENRDATISRSSSLGKVRPIGRQAITAADLSAHDLLSLLGGPGLNLRTGRFVNRIFSTIPGVGAGLHLLYADYPLSEAESFTDFYVHLDRPTGLRRWFRPQVRFRLDVTIPFKPLPLHHAFPMLEWGLNWCIASHCHQYLVIHAAVVEKDGHAMIFPAPPGSGKSTLCAGLVARGWRLLSDELTLIEPATGVVVPLPRPINLKNASIDVIRRFAPESVISKPTADTTKGTVAHMKAPRASVLRATETALPGWIVFPRFIAGSPARLQSWSKANAFMRLADNAFNYSLLGAAGFDALASVVDRSLCYEFSYGDLEEATALFAELPAPCA